jgi:EmrB/QacA subfamily drug resistance transporter
MPADAGVQWSHRDIKRIVSGVMLGMLLAAFDQTVVVTALPTMAAELNGLQHLSWIVTAYLLTSTASTPIYGKLSDHYGRRRLFEIAIAVFVASSALCALAQTMDQLIAARALQGIGGGGLISMAQAILADVIAPRERGRYQAYMSGTWALASIGGPAMGGFFVEYLTWRWVFWINLPIGIFALLACRHALRRLVTRGGLQRIDYLGAALLIVAVTLLLLVAASGGTELPWTSPEILGSLAVSIVLLLAFALQELRARDPILPPRLFLNPVIRVANLISFVVSMAMFGASVLLPVFLQLVSRIGAGNSGLLLIPLLGGSVAGSFAASQRMRHTGRYKQAPIVGLAVSTVGWLLLATMTQTTPGWLAGIYMGLLGAGIGSAMPMMMVATQNAAETRDIGVATASVTFFRSLGGSFGAAILWSILVYALGRHLAAMGAGGPESGAALLRSGGPASTALPEALVPALAQSFSLVFIIGAAITAVSLVLICLIKEIPLRTTPARAASIPVE